MKTYVITEIWTRQYVMQAKDEEAALVASAPSSSAAAAAHCLGLNLSNWHAHEVPAVVTEQETDDSVTTRL